MLRGALTPASPSHARTRSLTALRSTNRSKSSTASPHSKAVPSVKKAAQAIGKPTTRAVLEEDVSETGSSRENNNQTEALDLTSSQTSSEIIIASGSSTGQEAQAMTFTAKRPAASVTASPHRSRASLKSLRHHSPSPRPATRLSLGRDFDSSLARFSPSASYAQLDTSKMDWSPSGMRIGSRHPSDVAAEENFSDLSIELGSSTAADNGLGQGKVDMSIQVGSPALLFRDSALASSKNTRASSSQRILSTNEFPSTAPVHHHSAPSSDCEALFDVPPLKPAPKSKTSGSRRGSSSKIGSGVLQSVSAGPPPATVRALSTSASVQNAPQLSRSDWADIHEAANDDQAANSSVEIMNVRKGDKKIPANDKENVQQPPSASQKSVAPTASKSGWFARPQTSSRSESTVASSATIAARAPAPTAREGTARHAKQANAWRKQDTNDELRARYPIDFEWSRWGKPSLVYTNDEREVDRVLAKLDGDILGFDLEWEPSRTRGKENKTALVQVCDTKTVLLVHVSRMKRFPESLKALIEDPKRVKLGVQIGGDAAKLSRDFDHAPKGLLELNNVARLVDAPRYETKRGLTSLQVLCATYLDRFMSKDPRVRQGKWASAIDKEQQSYAANDVVAALHIFLTLRDLAKPGMDVLGQITKSSTFKPTLRADASTGSLASTQGLKDSSGRPLVPKPRQLETYKLWHQDQLSLEEVSSRMSIKPVSVLWNLVECFTTVEGAAYEYDEQRFLDLYDTIEGGVPSKLQKDAAALIADVRARQAAANSKV